MRSLRGQAPMLLALMAVAGCDAASSRPRVRTFVEPGVSVQHLLPTGGSKATGLNIAASYDVATVSWTSDRSAASATSHDSGRTFENPASIPSGTPSTPRARVAPAVLRAAGHTWRVAAAAQGNGRDWTIELPALAPKVPPIAIEESCGLIAIVAVERGATDVRLVLRRNLPPFPASPRTVGAEIGTPIELGRLPALAAPPVSAPLPEAALVAWQEPGGIRVVRVELPGVMCGRSMAGGTAWQP